MIFSYFGYIVVKIFRKVKNMSVGKEEIWMRVLNLFFGLRYVLLVNIFSNVCMCNRNIFFDVLKRKKEKKRKMMWVIGFKWSL